jgi:hypothetical protein
VIRDDLSNKLIHLVRGDTVEDAFGRLQAILDEGQLRGGNGFIRGGYNCVCFTESPIGKLGYVLASPDRANMRYQPFGVMLDKTFVYNEGGRPVIYQPEEDYTRLPEDLRYRHVRFDLSNADAPVDHTWEREWRIRTDALRLPVDATTIVLPNRQWRDHLMANHADNMAYAVAAMGEVASMSIEPFPWNIAVLEDLGFKIR